MKKFYECLRKHAMKIINLKMKNMELLTKEQQESYENAKTLIFANENLKINIWKIYNIVKLEIIVIMQQNAEVLHVAYAI